MSYYQIAIRTLVLMEELILLESRAYVTYIMVKQEYENSLVIQIDS